MALAAKGEPSSRAAGIVHERLMFLGALAGVEGDVDGDELGDLAGLLFGAPELEPELEPPLPPPPPPQAVTIKARQLMASHRRRGGLSIDYKYRPASEFGCRL